MLSDTPHEEVSGAATSPDSEREPPQNATNADIEQAEGKNNKNNNDEESERKITIIHDTRREAPNLSLNLQYDPRRRGIFIAACAGILLQASVLTFFGLMVLHPGIRENFKKEDKFVSNSAFSMAFSGTVLLNVGLYICAHVVESSTKEEQFESVEDADIYLYWIQQKQTVNDQVFESFALCPKKPSTIVTMSRRNLDSQPAFQSWDVFCRTETSIMNVKTSIGTFVTIAGFILQFIGLRAMNSYASLAQLGAVGLMTAWRAWLRRGFANDFDREKLLPGHELDWLAWELTNRWYDPTPSHGRSDNTSAASEVATATARANSLGTGSSPDSSYDSGSSYDFGSSYYFNSSYYGSGSWVTRTDSNKTSTRRRRGFGTQQHHRHPGSWLPVTGMSGQSVKVVETDVLSKGQRILETRRELGKLTNFRGPTSQESVHLAQAIETTMEELFPPKPDAVSNRDLEWELDITMRESSGEMESKVSIKLSPVNTRWEVRADDLNAILSLWIYSVQDEERKTDLQGNTKKDAWMRRAAPPKGVRWFGPTRMAECQQLFQDLRWWMPRHDIRFLIGTEPVSRDMKDQTISQSPIHRRRIVGCVSDEVDQPLLHSTGYWTSDAAAEWADVLSVNSQYRGALAVESSVSLDQLYTRDLLFSFLRWVAKQLPAPLSGPTEIQESSGNESFTYASTKRLRELAESFQSLGFGSEAEVYLTLISPFSLAKKLPVPRAIFDKAQKDAQAAYIPPIRAFERIQRVFSTSEVSTILQRLGRKDLCFWCCFLHHI